MNGSRTTYTTPHKKKLWNSLELSNTLKVENVTVDHSGEYTCTASSGLMEKRASAFVKVYGGSQDKYFSFKDDCRCSYNPNPNPPNP